MWAFFSFFFLISEDNLKKYACSSTLIPLWTEQESKQPKKVSQNRDMKRLKVQISNRIYNYIHTYVYIFTYVCIYCKMTIRPHRFDIRPSSFLKLEGFSVGNLSYYLLQPSCANKLLLLFLAFEVRKKMTDDTFSSFTTAMCGNYL